MRTGSITQISGILFWTKKSLTEYIRAIVGKYKDEQTLDKWDTAFVLELIHNHPQAATKLGVGIKSIIVRRNPVYTQTRGFYLNRIDGTGTDVSWTECLTPTPHHKKVIRAMRYLIEEQTFLFKQKYFDDTQSPICELTGESMTFLDAHVDHKSPLTFDKLVEDFCKEYGIDLNTVPLRDDLADNKYMDLLDDDLLALRWQEYHRQRAVLRVVSRFGNLSIAKIGNGHDR
jgi:hypothetical protein